MDIQNPRHINGRRHHLRAYSHRSGSVFIAPGMQPETYSTGEVARLFGYGKNRFLATLRKLGMLHGDNAAKEKHVRQGHLIAQVKHYWHPTLLTYRPYSIARITNKGIQYINAQLNKKDISHDTQTNPQLPPKLQSGKHPRH